MPAALRAAEPILELSGVEPLTDRRVRIRQYRGRDMGMVFEQMYTQRITGEVSLVLNMSQGTVGTFTVQEKDRE